MPAILKGWFERVLAYGVAYADGKRFDRGYFVGKRGVLCTTTGGTRERFSKGGTYGTIESVLYPIHRCMMEYIGLEVMEPFVAYAAPRVDDETRVTYLRHWGEKLRTIVSDAAWQTRLEEAVVIQTKNKEGTDSQGWALPR